MCPQFRAIAFAALIALSSTVVVAEDVHSRIRAAVSNGRDAEALRELRVLEDDSADIFIANNYDYLAARLVERTGDRAEAMQRFESAVRRGSPLAEYALFHLSRIARDTGNLFLERVYISELLFFYPESLVTEAAARRLAHSYYESGSYDLAISALKGRPLGDRIAGGAASPRDDLVLLAKAYERTGNADAARGIYTDLIASMPSPEQPDDAALDSARGLDRIGGELSAEEHFRRASIYQFNRDFAAARGHYIAIVDGNLDRSLMPDAVFQIGRGFAQEGNFADAVLWYERAWEQYPNLELAKDVLLQTGSAYSRMGKNREAVTRYRIYIDRYPEDERVDRAYLNIVDISRDLGETSDALRQTAAAADRFRGTVGEAQAAFAEARIYISSEDWNAAIGLLERLLRLPNLGGAAVPGGTSRAEALFLQGYVLEQLRQFDGAVEAYLSIPDGRDQYYGWRATERLRAMAASAVAENAVASRLETLLPELNNGTLDQRRRSIQTAIRMTGDIETRERLIASLARIYEALPEYRIPSYQYSFKLRDPVTDSDKQPVKGSGHSFLARELAFLGLFDEAAPEMEASGLLKGQGGEYTLAEAYRRGGYPHRGLSFIESRWQKVPADYQPELIPEAALEMLYPAGFADAARRHAGERAIDPRFLMAIARQESRFRPEVRSIASARGMMQFIPSTASRTAAELGLDDFVQDDLYDPDIALEFASQYISGLFKTFPNQPDAVAASYNGGDDNVRRWVKRSSSSAPERYVPEIAFAQTKDYTYKVMSNYRIYQIFYDEELRRK
jgi:tetratricopeptide (TPR) repeat protein